MMVDHKRIYLEEAEQYQRLVAREDYQGNLLPAIRRIAPLVGKDLVDLGSGTGRLISLCGPSAGSLFAFDLSPHMLNVAVPLFQEMYNERWLAAAADHRAIPLAAGVADLVLSGWSFCYLAVWHEERWEETLQEGLKEIKRVLREDGWVIIIETLGTGVETPQRLEKLEGYFNFLEKSGFRHSWIRTDYRFQNQEEAKELTAFFFGEDMLAHLSQDPQPILPECTGIWSCRAGEL